jgi:hypothetical protein
MAAIFPKIYDHIDSNPSRMKGLVFESPVLKEKQDGTPWDLFMTKPLPIPGPISLILWHTDTLYSYGLPSLQKSILREKILELQEQAESLGRRWSKKKVQDLLARQLEGAPSEKMLEEVLCELFQVQKVVIHKEKKSIGFYPTDMRLWKSDRLVLFADEDNRWIMTPNDTDLSLLAWITGKEEDGWSVAWPTAEGKFEEMKAEVSKRQLDVHPLPGSPLGTRIKKDDWARVLGRAEAIESWTKLALKVTQ